MVCWKAICIAEFLDDFRRGGFQTRPYGFKICDFIVEDLGLIEYKKAWKLQDQYAAEIAAGTRPPTLLLLEHPHVYTFGRRGQAENLLWNESELKDKDVAVHWVDRGGDVTYHGPGQLVGYPLIPLSPLGVRRLPTLEAQSQETLESVRLPDADYVGYVRKLEQTAHRRVGASGCGSRPTVRVDRRVDSSGCVVALSQMSSRRQAKTRQDRCHRRESRCARSFPSRLCIER